jgi:hypothetical protein
MPQFVIPRIFVRGEKRLARSRFLRPGYSLHNIMLKRIVILFTLAIFTFVTSSCTTSENNAASSKNTVRESSESSINPKTIALAAGAVAVGVVLVFVLANVAAKGIGENIGGSIA